MSENRKYFTFIWKLKNFHYSYKRRDPISTSFFVQALGETRWKIEFCPQSRNSEDYMICYVQRGLDSGPDRYNLDFELSFLASDGEVLHSEIVLNKSFMKNSTFNFVLAAHRDDMYLHKRSLFFPDDTFTIRCKMWYSSESIFEFGRCFAETVIKVKSRSFLGTINNFSRLEEDSETLVRFESNTTRTFFSYVHLRVDTEGQLVVKITPDKNYFKDFHRCKIFIVKTNGYKSEAGDVAFRDHFQYCVPLSLSKNDLLMHGEQYLQYNKLTIEWEITFPLGTTTEQINEPEYGPFCQDTQKLVPLNLINPQASISLKDDLLSLLRESILCDTALKTATKTFPAHMNILSARSSVFKKMFCTNMKEKITKCVEIDDLDAQTVHRMLLFLYSDTLNDLEYESLKSLYIAADKYDIISLKRECSKFLKQNLSPSNCCEVFLLADFYQDKEMKNAVEDFVDINFKAILTSDEWKNFKVDHSKLTIELLCNLFMKHRGN